MIWAVFDSNCFKVLTVFSLSPGKSFIRKELQELTRLNNVPLDSALKKLKDSGVLECKENKFSLVFTKSNQKLLELVEGEHQKLKLIPLKVYFALIDFTEKIWKKDCQVYLFGSYSKLNFTTDSDIDLAVVGDEFELGFVKRIEDRYGKEIQVHFIPRGDADSKDAFIASVFEGTRLV